MSYVQKPSLIDTIGYNYPDHVVSTTDPETYASIVWEAGTPITEAALSTDRLAYYRSLVSEKIRDDAHQQRYAKALLVLGTEDPEQIRTYEEKYAEASAYLVHNASPTPIMSAEAAHTGEVVSDLAALVVSQYDVAKATLKVLWGHVEGVRRLNLSIVASYDITQLEAYAGPSWA